MGLGGTARVLLLLFLHSGRQAGLAGLGLWAVNYTKFEKVKNVKK